MSNPIAVLFRSIDHAYQDRTYFTRLKARLLASFALLLLVWVPFNVVKLLVVHPPFISHRFVVNGCFVVSAALAFVWVRRGRIERAGNSLSLGALLPAHLAVVFAPQDIEPLAAAITLFATDLVFILLALVFSARWAAGTILGTIAVTHVWLHYHALHVEPERPCI